MHYLRPELVAALEKFRSGDARPADTVFRGKVPRVRTLKGDLKRAGIPFEDERGQRADFHALRTTLATMLAAKGVSLQASKALMRHSDVKLTLKVYTDESHLPLIQAMDTLPSLSVPNHSAQLTAQAGDSLGREASNGVASSRSRELSQVSPLDPSGREKAASVASSRLSKMVGPERFELSTSCTPCKRATRLRYGPNKRKVSKTRASG